MAILLMIIVKFIGQGNNKKTYPADKKNKNADIDERIQKNLQS